ncbi:MAG TPA: hypothetical protein VLD67_19435 [Vicinamibacterales bacterium]|nr:hypothetical protein [Vicinamibacterales bacterium]
MTNHAVVAMIDEDVKQTRCTTCDAEHPYKGGAAPRRRRKDAPGALYQEVLAGMSEAGPTHALTHPEPPASEAASEDAVPDESPVDVESLVEEASGDGPPESSQEEGPVHRPLIRATLPRVEGQKERPLPEFTVRQSGQVAGRGNGNFRPDLRARHRGGHGGHRSLGGNRFGGGRQGPGRGPSGRGGNFRPQPPRHGGGKKRSR